MKPNILIIAGVFPPEPVVSANLLRDVAINLSQDSNVTVICPPPTRPLGFQMAQTRQNLDFPFKVIEVNSFTFPESKLVGRLKESYSLGKEACKYIDAHHKEIDLIHIATWPLAAEFMIAKKAQKYKIPYWTLIQDIYPESLASHLPTKFIQNLANKLLLPIDKYHLQHADLIHTISDKMIDHLSKTRRVPRDRFVKVRNWQNEEDFITFHASPEGRKEREEGPVTFMYMGNVGPLAGLDVVIDAFKIAGLQRARLVIAGSGSVKKKLEDRVTDEGLNNIEFWDVPQGMVPATQHKADIMILPIKKGFARFSIPSKLPAYMFSKKPVLASVDAGSDTAECIVSSDSGWTVEPENPEALAAKMRECMAVDPQRLREMGERGFDFAMQNLSKSHNLQILVDACRAILK